MPNYQHLQRSHFRLGGAKFQETSTHTADFPPLDVNAHSTLDEATRSNLRKSHFSLVSDAKTQSTGSTETRSQFQPHENVQVVKSENLHRQPGSITLGNEQNDFKSTHEMNFVQREDCAAQAKIPQLQSNNFELGHDSCKYYASTNNVQFKKFSSEDYPSPTTRKTQHSNLPLTDQFRSDFKTETSANFIPRDSDNQIITDLRRFQQSSIKLNDGHTKMPNSTTRDALQESKNANATTSPVQNLHQKPSSIKLRDNDVFAGQSESRATYTIKDDIKPAKMLKPDQENTTQHVCYPDPNAGKGHTSEMRAEFKTWDADFNTEDAQKIKKFMQHGTDPNSQKQSLVMNNYQSSTRSDYVPIKVEKVEAENNRRHLENHISMKYDPSPMPYTTTQREALLQSQQAQAKAKMSPIDNKIRESHVKLSGNNNCVYVSESRDQFIPRIGDREAIDQEKINDLRKSHYSLGNDKTIYKSTQLSEITAHDDYVEDGKYVGSSKNAQMEAYYI
ncbi:Conserved_hypothetical protein [Hexamita inflata]|uniref:Uncharacterized protein n=1 Tax=Hexamita inflata TaxID=28002 RepID=A0AA86R9T7_9EUKA|nr:Conserved hypothetical protein [Hexamita inflata]CAI9964250.1 Conserved hypothetical protein [Hexamita inflata]